MCVCVFVCVCIQESVRVYICFYRILECELVLIRITITIIRRNEVVMFDLYAVLGFDCWF